jgi:hypothetical protein
MVNFRIGRILVKSMPMLETHIYFFFNATDSNLLLIGESYMGTAGWWHDFHGVWLLNPFTGVKISFMVYLYGNEVKAVACINANPPGLFVSNLFNHIAYIDPTTNCNFTFPVLPCIMKHVGYDIYVVNSFGSIFFITAATSDEGNTSIMMTLIIEAEEEDLLDVHSPSYYLMESVEDELLLVTRSTPVQTSPNLIELSVQVHKVDVERKVIEPVTDIGRHVIFIRKVRSFIIDAFPTIEAGRIYFVDAFNPTILPLYTIISSHLANQRHELIYLQGFYPRTFLEVLVQYYQWPPIYAISSDPFPSKDEAVLEAEEVPNASKVGKRTFDHVDDVKSLCCSTR